MIAHNPLDGSGRAAFPHPTLALGSCAHATQGIGMMDRDDRQWAQATGVDEALHAIPEDATALAAPRRRAMPESPRLEPKNPQRRCVSSARRSSGGLHARPLATT
jgi:hypothetical protein